MIRSLKNTRIELNCWMDKEDDMWRQRLRISWLQSGDRNTGFFHEKASARYKKNFIDGFLDENGRWLEGDEHVEELMLQNYERLFTSSGPTNFEEILDAIQHKVTPRMNQVLVREFQKLKWKMALSKCTRWSLQDRMACLHCFINTFGPRLVLWLLQLFWPSLI